MTRKPFYEETYKGYRIVLQTFDWDDMHKVYLDGRLVNSFQDLADAREWINKQTEKRT